MKYAVYLNISGNLCWFECYAGSVQEAKDVARAQYPNARIVSASATFL